MTAKEGRSAQWLVTTVFSAVTAAHGSSSFSSCQCAAAVTTVFSAVTVAVTTAVVTTAAATTIAVADKKRKAACK